MDLNIANNPYSDRHDTGQAECDVFIVHSDTLVRNSLAQLVKAAGWQSEAFGSGEEFLRRPPHSGPCCVVVDLALPGLGGLELQRRVALRSDMPVIFVTEKEEAAVIVLAMKAGAVEFLIEPFSDELSLNAVRDAIERSRVAVHVDSELRALRDCYGSLTWRERDVMALVVAGLLNKQVGSELGISEITVKTRRGRVMRKMKADSLPELVRMAVQLDLPPAHKRLRNVLGGTEDTRWLPVRRFDGHQSPEPNARK